MSILIAQDKGSGNRNYKIDGIVAEHSNPASGLSIYLFYDLKGFWDRGWSRDSGRDFDLDQIDRDFRDKDCKIGGTVAALPIFFTILRFLGLGMKHGLRERSRS